MFDFGIPELILIVLIILLVVGPQDIPRVMFRAGRLMRAVTIQWDKIRNAVGEVMHEAELVEYRRQATEMKEEAEKELMADFEPEKALDASLNPPKKKKAKKDE